MKILIATGIYPPDIGGPATYSKLLFDELPKRDIAVEVLSFGEVRHLPKIVRHLTYFLKVLKRARGADIIFAQDPVSVGLPSAIAAKVLRKKFILKIVGDYAWEQGRQRFGVNDLLDDFVNQKYNWKVELLRKIQKFVANSAFLIITPSEYLKKIITKWGIGGEKIKVIYNAFSAPELALSKSEAREKLNLSGSVLISAGRLVPWKGFKMLIKIMPEILKEIPEATLYIIGSGPDKEVLDVEIANHGLRNRVFLIGQVSHKNSLLYLRAGDLFVLNTSYEGFSHFILEALAMEIPVITTNVGGNPEVIKSGEDGILVEHNSKGQFKKEIIRLMRNENLRRKLTDNAEKKVGEFPKERMLNELIAILINTSSSQDS